MSQAEHLSACYALARPPKRYADVLTPVPQSVTSFGSRLAAEVVKGRSHWGKVDPHSSTTGVLTGEENATWRRRHTRKRTAPCRQRQRSQPCGRARHCQGCQQPAEARKRPGRVFFYRCHSGQGQLTPRFQALASITSREDVPVVLRHLNPPLPCLPSVDPNYAGSLQQ